MQIFVSTRWALACVGFALGMAFSWVSHADLVKRFNYESKSNRVREWRELGKALSPYQLVFVTSGDEIFIPHRSFFDNAVAVQLELGQEPAWISTGFFESYEANAKLLSAELARVRRESGKSLIVIGNPQTSVDVLYALLKEPQLTKAVAKFALLSPAFGSPLVDWTDRLAPEALEMLRTQFGEDLRKFNAAGTRALFDTLIATLAPEAVQLISDRVNYVRLSAPGVVSVTPVLRPGYLALRAGGATDAVSYTSDQKLDQIKGHDLGVLRADHWDLWASLPVSNSPSTLRRAFTRALLGELLEFPGQR